jgi:hypothetical protein
MRYKMRNIKLALIGVALALTGCASGIKYQDMGASIATLAPDQGRIYFYRSNSMFGAAVQPNLRMDGVTVGSSKPGGFFYVDATPGGHEVSAKTEVENKLTFMLDKGETKYVRTSPSFGLFVGHIVPELVGPDMALQELQDLSYIGDKATIASGINVVHKSELASLPRPQAENGGAVASAVPPVNGIDTTSPLAGSPVTAESAANSAPGNIYLPIEPVHRAGALAEVVKVEFKLGESSVTIERMAKEQGCESYLGAGLLAHSGPWDVYRVQCVDGRKLMAKCEFRQCAFMPQAQN